MTFTAFLNKHSSLLFITGALIAIILGGYDVNFWGLVDKNGKQLLTELDKGLIELKEIELTGEQEKEIANLIAKDPEKYSLLQKALISKKSGADILKQVGEGRLNATDVYLNFKQYNEVKTLINTNPLAYSDYQKSLIKEKTGSEILLEVGMGKLTPSSLKLTVNQHDEIKELLLSHPNKYSVLQKSLIPEIKEELEKLLDDVVTEKITLSLTGKEILNEVGNGNYTSDEIRLTDSQYKEIKELLLKAPDQYNRQQKKLIKDINTMLKLPENAKEVKEKKVVLEMSGREILEQIGMGNLSADEIKLTLSQFNEIDTLIKADPANYNANQKSLIK